jgi:hypothetical protein
MRRALTATLASLALAAGLSAAPAAASAGQLLPVDWYRVGPYSTLEYCRVALADAAANGEYTGLGPCRWYAASPLWPAGYYFAVYIP